MTPGFLHLAKMVTVLFGLNVNSAQEAPVSVTERVFATKANDDFAPVLSNNPNDPGQIAARRRLAELLVDKPAVTTPPLTALPIAPPTLRLQTPPEEAARADQAGWWKPRPPVEYNRAPNPDTSFIHDPKKGLPWRPASETQRLADIARNPRSSLEAYLDRQRREIAGESKSSPST